MHKIHTPPYPAKFKIGDIAIAKFDVDFDNVKSHRVGQKLPVTDENVSYYNVCHEEYVNFDAWFAQIKSAMKQIPELTSISTDYGSWRKVNDQWFEINGDANPRPVNLD